MGIPPARVEGRIAPSAVSPIDRVRLLDEAQALAAHPAFDEAMRAFSRGLPSFYAAETRRRTGIADTITWPVAVLVLHFDAAEPAGLHASRLVALCCAGGLSGRTATFNAISSLRHSGMIAVDRDRGPGLPQRLRPTSKLLVRMQDELAVRLESMERVVSWPAPAAEWARSPGVLGAFLGRNIAAYREAKFLLYHGFPEVRMFMDRRHGYVVLLETLGRSQAIDGGAHAVLPPSEVAAKYAVSRAHVRKLFAAAAGQKWLSYERGGRIVFSAETYTRLRLWIAHEFAWTRWLLGFL
jgi:hypothetical protein